MNLHKHHLFIPSTVTTNTQKKKKWWWHFWKLDIFKFVPFIQDLGAIIKKHIYWCRATYLQLFVSKIKYQQNSIHFVRSSFTNVIEFTKTCPDGNHFQSPGDKYQATGRHNSAALKWKKKLSRNVVTSCLRAYNWNDVYFIYTNFLLTPVLHMFIHNSFTLGSKIIIYFENNKHIQGQFCRN